MCSYQNWSARQKARFLPVEHGEYFLLQFILCCLFAKLIDFVVHLPFLTQFLWVTVSGYPPNPKKMVLVSNSEGLLGPLSPYHTGCPRKNTPLKFLD